MVKRKTSSPRKPTKKAASPAPSITSSTIVNNIPSEVSTSHLLDPNNDGTQLSPDMQRGYLTLLSKGASPAAACYQLGLNLMMVAATIEADETFRNLLARVNQLLSQNVAAALYRSAMEGSVSAQTFFLKNKPPPEWPHTAPDDPASEHHLSDDELIEQFRTGATLLLAELSKADSPKTRETKP